VRADATDNNEALLSFKYRSNSKAAAKNKRKLRKDKSVKRKNGIHALLLILTVVPYWLHSFSS
jgi:hypothetical protein